MVALMRPLGGHANRAEQAVGGIPRRRQFRRADAYRDLREAEPHEISQKRAFSHNFDNY
jgi:hypothetical protein